MTQIPPPTYDEVTKSNDITHPYIIDVSYDEQLLLNRGINRETAKKCLCSPISLIIIIAMIALTALLVFKFVIIAQMIDSYKEEIEPPFQFIRWYRDGNILADTGNPDQLPVDRVELFSNGSIQFSFVSMDDTGDYYCEIETTNGSIARQFHAIEVLYPPTIRSNPSGYIDAKLGSVFEIVCEAHGVPNPIITWRVNDEIVTEMYTSQNSYFVDVKSRTQAGSIECIANNGVNTPAVAGIILIVLFAPEINATKNVVHTKIGLRADLECYSTSNPSAAVHWFRRGSPLITDYRIVRRDHEMTTNESTSRPLNHVSKHTLTIKYVQDTDLGTYECRAENKIGYTGAHIELTGRPLAPNFKTSPPSVDNSSYNLVWYTESISPIYMYELKFRQVPSRYMLSTNRFDNIDWRNITVPSDNSEGPVHTIFYSLTGLWPAHSYEVTVRAKNRYGWSDNSNIIRFITNGEVEIPNYTTEIIDYNYNEEVLLSETDSDSPPQSSLTSASSSSSSSSSSYYEKTTNKVKSTSSANANKNIQRYRSLQSLLQFKNPEGQVVRWIERFGNYHYNIVHRNGRLHGNADALLK